MTPGTGIPLWLQQILPQSLREKPAFTEAAWAFCVSVVYGTVPIIGTAYGIAVSQGAADTIDHFAVFLAKNWFGIVMGYFFGSGIATVRGHQAAVKASAAKDASG